MTGVNIRERQHKVFTQGRPCEEATRGLPSAGQGQRLQKKPNPTATLFFDFQSKTEKIIFSCSSHSTSGIFL